MSTCSPTFLNDCSVIVCILCIGDQQAPVASLELDVSNTNSTCIAITWQYTPDSNELDPHAVTTKLQRGVVDTATPVFNTVVTRRGQNSYSDCGLGAGHIYSYRITAELE